MNSQETKKLVISNKFRLGIIRDIEHEGHNETEETTMRLRQKYGGL